MYILYFILSCVILYYNFSNVYNEYLLVDRKGLFFFDYLWKLDYSVVFFERWYFNIRDKVIIFKDDGDCWLDGLFS